MIEYGWRRFNSAATSTTGAQTRYLTTQYNKGCYSWLAEIVGQNDFPKVYGGEGADAVKITVRPDTYPDEGSLILLGANFTEEYGNMISTSSVWDLEDQYVWYNDYSSFFGIIYNSNPQPVAVWSHKVGDDNSYRNVFQPGYCLGYSYMVCNGTIRQSVSMSNAYQNSFRGMDLTLPETPLEGSMIVGFQCHGGYNGASAGYEQNPGYDWMLVTDVIMGYSHDPWFTGIGSTRWMVQFVQGGDTSEITEGWTTEQLYLKKQIVQLKGQPGRGSLNVYDSDGNRLTFGEGWSWSMVNEQKIKISNKVKTKYVTVTYLNTESRLRYGHRSRLMTDASTVHDRIRYNDIRGL